MFNMSMKSYFGTTTRVIYQLPCKKVDQPMSSMNNVQGKTISYCGEQNKMKLKKKKLSQPRWPTTSNGEHWRHTPMTRPATSNNDIINY